MRKNGNVRAIGETEAELGGETSQMLSANEDDAVTAEEGPGWEPCVSEPRRSVWPAVVTAFALLLVAGWTAFFLWTKRDALGAPPTPQQAVEWVGSWAVPVLLVAIAWLIAMRSSSREASRFGNAARVLADEAANLEQRLVVVNRELSLAREFLAAQSRDLDYVGRSAAERISEHAGKLQALVSDNGAQVEQIAGVSATALANMSELRDNLPVIANSARDVTNQIGGAGRSAKAQLGELVAGFERLNEFGQASERQVENLRERLDTALGELSAYAEALDAANAERVTALRAEYEGTASEIAAREEEAEAAAKRRADALLAQLTNAHETARANEESANTAMRARLAAFRNEATQAGETVRAGERAALEAWTSQIADLHRRLETTLSVVAELDRKALESAREKLAELEREAEAVDSRLAARDVEFQSRITERQSALETSETGALARLASQTEEFDRVLAERQAAQTARATEVAQTAAALAAQLAQIEAHADAIVARSASAEETLDRSAAHLASAVRDNDSQLAATEEALARLTDSSVRLLEIIQAAAQHSKVELPAAIAGFEDKLGSARSGSEHIKSVLDDARDVAGVIGGQLAEMHGASGTAVADLDAFRERLTGTAEEQAAALARLREDLSAANAQNRELADAISGDLAKAIAELRQSGETMLAELAQARDGALSELEGGQEERIAAISRQIGERSAEAIDRAMESRTGDTIRRLDGATVRAAEATNETLGQLRNQLARVHELTSNLEARAARAREQVEEQSDSDFARRMALITESLNSHSIDIAKALSSEVTDTAWSAYLKGDRGVFTRRAIRLLGGGEAREVAALYRDDHDFRENVSRYIHDFETMLRGILSTREGHALGVTLLSSDMGKLYVALAQAIQRLRG